jgi:hypothetical protein
LWLRWACVLLALCAFNSMAVSEVGNIQSQTWLTAVDGFFYGSLSLAFIVNVLIWITTRQSIHGLFVGVIIFSMFSSLTTDHYFYRLDLGIWSEQKGVIELWLFAGMTSSAMLFTLRILCLHQRHSLLERNFNWIAVAILAMVLPAVVWVNAAPFLWAISLAVFVAFGVTSLMVSLRNVYKVRSLQNILITLAFLVCIASQWFGMCVFLELFSETAFNQIVWKMGLITCLILLQVALIIEIFERRNDNKHNQAVQNPLNPQADHHASQSLGLDQLHEQLMHDFKTPLAIIDSSVQSLKMLEHQEDPQRSLRYDRIRRAVTRIDSLLMRSIITEKNKLNSAEEKDG